MHVREKQRANACFSDWQKCLQVKDLLGIQRYQLHYNQRSKLSSKTTDQNREGTGLGGYVMFTVQGNHF